jgi:hypothetical protein
MIHRRDKKVVPVSLLFFVRHFSQCDMIYFFNKKAIAIAGF